MWGCKYVVCFWARWWLSFGNDEWQNRKEELDTGEKKAEKEESIGCTSSDEMCQSNIQQENAKEDDQVARPPLKYVYSRTGKPRISHLISQVENRNQLSNRNRHLQPSNLFSHSTSRHEVMVLLFKYTHQHLFVYVHLSILFRVNMHLHATKCWFYFINCVCINHTAAPLGGTAERSGYYYSRSDPCLLNNTTYLPTYTICNLKPVLYDINHILLYYHILWLPL